MTQKPKGAYDAIELTLTEGETQPWESKCGGCPYLESEADYPRDKDGKPMMFLAQINLDEMPHVNKLPEQGLLQFYVSDKEMYGLDSPCRVIYIPEYKKDASVLLSKNPFEEAYENDKPYEGEGRYEFKSETDDWFSPGHLVGGEPFFVYDTELEEDEDYTMLFQMESDEQCGIMFGDDGNAQFFIDTEDLKNKNFDNVEYAWQCS